MASLEFQKRLLNNVGTNKTLGSWRWTGCVLLYELDMSPLGAKSGRLWFKGCVRCQVDQGRLVTVNLQSVNLVGLRNA
jgi:hypothetical protein